MPNQTIKNVILISDDEEDKSPKEESALSSEGLPTPNKQPEVNKNIKITVEQKPNQQNSTKVVIEIDDLPSSQETAKQEAYRVFLDELRDDSFTLEFSQLLELCLKYECSDGMSRILQRNLIPHYRAADRAYIESLTFQSLLENSLSNLEREPHFKFSTIKSVCEALKCNKAKKRVGFVTLDKKVSEKRKTQYNSEVQKKRPNRELTEIIDLDSTETSSITSGIIDLDSLQYDDVEIIENNDKQNAQNDLKVTEDKSIAQTNEKIVTKKIPKSSILENVLKSVQKSSTETKQETLFKGAPNSFTQTNEEITAKRLPQSSTQTNEQITAKRLPQSPTQTNEENLLKMLPKVSTQTNEESLEPSLRAMKPLNIEISTSKDTETTPKSQEQLRIDLLEREIESLQRAIKALDEMEVLSDCASSPYLAIDRYQATLLSHYKELCVLRGESPVRRKCKGIQLSVPEGHPAGPARALQDMMNEQILQGGGEDPPFPDFVDVVKCVTKASVQDQLGWERQKILVTAQLLFSQIGLALQGRRKRREWREMRRRVPGPVRDPADDDPALLARLEANRLLGEAREADVLDHYAKLENETKVNKKITILARQRDLALQNGQEINFSYGESPRNDLMLEFEVPQLEPEPQAAQTDIEIDIKPMATPKPIDPDIEIEVSDSEDYSSSENEFSDFELDDIADANKAAGTENSLNPSPKTVPPATFDSGIESSINSTNDDYTTTDPVALKHISYTNVDAITTEPFKDAGNTFSTATTSMTKDVNSNTSVQSRLDAFLDVKVKSELALNSGVKKCINDTNVDSITTEPLKDAVNTFSTATTSMTKEATSTTSEQSRLEPFLGAVKSESDKTEQEDDTLKFLLEIDKSKDEGFVIKTSIFDDEEPVVFIEISSSSESESDQEDCEDTRACAGNKRR